MIALPAAVAGGAPVIALLPFRTLGADPTAGLLAEGVVEDIIATLAALREPIVISSNSTRLLHGPGVDPVAAAARLGAHYLVGGTVRQLAGHVRIAAELVEARTGAVVWANAYEAPAETVFDMQGRIAARLVNMLAPRVNEAELRRSRRQPPSQLGAYHLLLQARDRIFRLEPGPFAEAGALLQRAAALDPGYAAVHAALADWYSLRIFEMRSVDRPGDMAQLEQSARKALRVDPGHPRALAILGHNRALAERRFEEAIELLDQAAEAAPNDAEVRLWCVPTLAYAGRAADAIAHGARAVSLSPTDPFLFRYEHFLGIAHYAAGDFEEAVTWGRRSALSNPNYGSNLRFTAAALSALGRRAEAAPLIARVLRIEPECRASVVGQRVPFRAALERVKYGERLAEAGLPT